VFPSIDSVSELLNKRTTISRKYLKPDRSVHRFKDRQTVFATFKRRRHKEKPVFEQKAILIPILVEITAILISIFDEQLRSH
jgi:hypothetical protein